jgi:hypothetical protein
MSVRSPGCARPLDERSWLTQHSPAQLLLEQLGGDERQGPEDPIGTEDAIGDQSVDVRVSSGTGRCRLRT